MNQIAVASALPRSQAVCTRTVRSISIWQIRPSAVSVDADCLSLADPAWHCAGRVAACPRACWARAGDSEIAVIQERSRRITLLQQKPLLFNITTITSTASIDGAFDEGGF